MFSPKQALILLGVVTVAVVAFFTLMQRATTPASITPAQPTPTPDLDTVVALQNPVPVQKTQESEVRSPDGKMKLIMEAASSGDNATYTFSVSETSQYTRTIIFSKTVLPGTAFELSPNAWSPDNKYLFLTEKTGSSVNYFVFRASGEYFTETEQYIDVVPLFVARDTGYAFSEVTGWDSDTLLHVFTTKEDGSRGPSFWFEIPSKAIIQLSSR